MFRLSLMIMVLTVPIFGCDQNVQGRHYNEVIILSPSVNVPMTLDSHAQSEMAVPSPEAISKQNVMSGPGWDVPQGWQEFPGGGMRLVTFKREDDPDAIDVSIVSLGGAAGGLEANLARWALQIGVDFTANQQKADAWIKGAVVLKTKDNLDARIFDYTQLQKDVDPASKSMVASLIETGDAIVFVKMTGTIKSVKENMEAFQALTRSVRQK